MNLWKSEKHLKGFLRPWTSTRVSLASILGPEPRKINLERSCLKNLCYRGGKKVNNEVNTIFEWTFLSLRLKVKPFLGPEKLNNLSNNQIANPGNLNLNIPSKGTIYKPNYHELLAQCHKSSNVDLSPVSTSYFRLLFLSLSSPSSLSLSSPSAHFWNTVNPIKTSCPLDGLLPFSNPLKEPIDSLVFTKRSTKLNKPELRKEPKKGTAYSSTTNGKSFSGNIKDGRQLLAIIELRLIRSQDVEANPGPTTGAQGSQGIQGNQTAELQVVSYNVRGLNDELKLRHLVNHCYKLNKNLAQDSVICLQETYIEKPGKLPYLWRGNFHVTQGLGNRLGCVTLLNHNLNVLHASNLGNRGHLLVLQKSGQQKATYIVCNIYAPNVNNREKITFFEELANDIAELETRFDCNRVIIAGDYNLVFKPSEAKNRLNSSQEKNVALTVENLLKNLNLVDVWESKPSFTWNRPNSESFSTIDHIFHSKGDFVLLKVTTDWSVSLSDHAMVIANLGIPNTSAPKRPNIPRLDPSIFDPENKTRLIEEINEMLGQIPPHWDPHQTLEFAKVCTRTVLEREQAMRKIREASEEELLNVELNTAINALERGEGSLARRLDLIDYVEELRVRKEILIENKGKRLAERLGTKWYNEGEKSTKYFLRILNRASPTNFEGLVDGAGTKLTSEEEIETEVVNFYKNLYENYPNQTTVSDDTFFDELPGIPRETDDLIADKLTKEELGAVLDSCRESAPGPDGITYSILKNLWTIFGPLLEAAWNHSLLTGNLPPSHKTSYLRLIPKVGKDKTKLTNWRPITLSNCDHKIISKAYAKRISERIAEHILERQTAYLKGRLINDNIRTIIGALKLSNSEPDISGLVVSLDAKKAFDSVEHSYIEKVLEKFGLKKFVPIFRALYKNLESNIIINGKIVRGYKIKRGVKQGDALSCVLFIMCIEPLQRNMEKNALIQGISSNSLGNLPKALSYADDVNCIVKNDQRTLNEIFKEYERLTNLAGLELNAEKTEILPFASENLNLNKQAMRFRFQYNQTNYDLCAVQVTKINGILFQQDEQAMKDSNLDSAIQRMEKHLKNWSARNLSVLGKILIVKTFGISQIIFILQSLVLDEKHFKKINHVLYKFIWNRHFAAAKAPERIKREIVNKPIKLGGLGMLDIKELDASLKLRALGRLLTSNHPFLVLVRNKLDLTDFFNPEIRTNLDELTGRGVKLLGLDRGQHLTSTTLTANTFFVKALKQIKIRRILVNNGHLSLAWHNLHVRGIRTINDLNMAELRTLERFIDKGIISNLRGATQLPNDLHAGFDLGTCIIKGGKFIKLTTLSSKAIRLNRQDNTPITFFKMGPIMTPLQTLNWGTNLAKITSTKHKDLILRLAHGELYSKERLHRYRLIDNPLCSRCGEIETLQHKYFECPYIKEIWKRTLSVTDKLRQSIELTETLTEKALGCTREPNRITLTIHAEIINRIRQLKDDEANLLMLPKLFVKKAVEWTLRRELNTTIKDSISELLNDY